MASKGGHVAMKGDDIRNKLDRNYLIIWPYIVQHFQVPVLLVDCAIATQTTCLVGK